MNLPKAKAFIALPGLESDENKLITKIENQHMILGLVTHMLNHHDEWPLKAVSKKNLESASDRYRNAITDGNYSAIKEFYPLGRVVGYSYDCPKCRYHLQHMRTQNER